MDIQNSLDFSYAKLKSQQQTWQAGSVFVHGIIVSYAVQYNKITYWLDIQVIVIVGVSGNNKLAITLIPVNKCTSILLPSEPANH